jgi:hypothetical protein
MMPTERGLPMTVEWFANFRNRTKRYILGPFTSRKTALEAALAHDPPPRHKTLYTGYGSLEVGGASFDIRWHDAETAPLMGAN